MDASEWSGRMGDVWSQEWRRTDRSFAGVSAALDAAILDLAPERGTALDIGCGAGGTSLALAAARPGLSVTGVDLSADLVAVAAERGRATANVRFQVADASDPPPTPNGYDLAVSRHGVMFFADPPAAFAAIRARLAPGAPLVFSCFDSLARNPWASDVVEAITGAPLGPAGDAPGPFAFADPDYVAALLRHTGWRGAELRPLDYTYVAGEGEDPVADALSFLSRIGPAARAFATLAEADRPAARDRLRAVLAPRRIDDAVAFPAAAWIWSARA